MRRTARPIALALVLGVAALTIGWLVWQSPDGHSRAASPATEHATSASDAGAPDASADDAAPVLSRESGAPEPSARTRVEPAPDAAPASSSPSAMKALVRVLVVGKQDGEPRTGVRIVASTDTSGQQSIEDMQNLRRPDAALPTTGAHGRAEIEIPAGVAHAIHVHEPASRRGTMRIVDALAPGETRELTIEIDAPAPERLVVGQLVDAETGAPVAGEVRTERAAGHGVPVATGADGRFELRAHAKAEHFASAFAGGYAQVVFHLGEHEDTQAEPLLVRMKRAAMIDARVRGPQGDPIADALVMLRTSASRLHADRRNTRYEYMGQDPVWASHTDAHGVVTLADLLPDEPLQLSVSAKGWPESTRSESLQLAPGEHRTIDVVLGVGATILGSLVDEKGAPIAGHEIWCAPTNREIVSFFRTYDRPSDTATTDARGRFRFDCVSRGLWRIGPAPVQRAGLAGVPPRADVVRVEDEAGEIALELRVHRGLYLAGHVVDPMGSPAPGCPVIARARDDDRRVNGSCDEAGAFRLGPVDEGPWTLTASGREALHANSEPVEARAGASEIELRLRAGAAVRVEVVEARTGEARACEVLALCGESGRSTRSADGSAEIGSLAPGAYTLVARAGDDVGWLRDVVLRENEIVDAGRIELSPGARLRVRQEGAAGRVHWRVMRDGAPLGWISLVGSSPDTVVVPAGPIELRWRTDAQRDVEHVERVEALLGREVEVVLREPR